MGAVAAIVLSGFPRAGHAPAAPATARGVPPYAVVLQHGGTAATVLNMFTGKVLGHLAPPVASLGFQWVAAAADDRTFVLADDQSTAIVTRFYLVHLAATAASLAG